MINSFKIGTKLMTGFLLVLLLTVLVAAAGVYIINVSGEQTRELYRVTQIAANVQTIQSLVLSAELMSERGSATRDVKYQTEAAGYLDKVAKIATDAKEISHLDETKNGLDKIIATVTKFKTEDAQWYKDDAARFEIRKNQQAKGAEVIKALNEVRKSVSDLGDAAIKTVPGIEEPVMSPPRFFPLLRSIDDVIIDFWTIRRLVALFDASTDNDKTIFDDGRIAISQNVATSVAELRKKLETTLESIKLEKNRELMGLAIKAVDGYVTVQQQYAAATMALGKLQDGITATGEQVVSQVDELVELMGKQVAEALTREETESARGLKLIYALTGIAIVLSICISVLLTRNITSGTKLIVDAMTKIATKGDLSVEFAPAFLARGDELGDLARGAELIVKDYQSVDKLAGELAHGNWNLNVRVKSDQDSMNRRLSQMLDDVNSVLREINTSVAQVATGSTEISSAAQSLSNGAQSSAASLEEISASMNEIQGQTKANASSASSARDLAQKMTTAATAGQTAMRDMNDSMGRITTNSQEVQRVIKVIDDIAFQTNLLALNAAVEAARAGQHGKGFAVVAEEVRNLAARSAKAAHETATLIANSSDEIKKGGEVATHTGTVLDSIVEQVKQTSDLISGIAVASDEQAQGVGQVTIGLQQIDGVIQQNTAAAEESASAANEMSGMAKSLQNIVGKFELRK
ncbi:MAG: methyl-accepting chemotaxis protein [Thermoguttaceae bacterium]